MKRIICKGGGEPVIQDLILNGNGQQRTAIIFGDFFPEDYGRRDKRRVHGPHYISFESWIKRKLSPNCHVVVPQTTPQEAREWISGSQALTIEGGILPRYLQFLSEMGLSGPIRESFLNGGIEELGGLSSGAMLMCGSVRYYVKDDKDPRYRLRTTGSVRGYRLKRSRGIELIPRTEVVPHFDENKGLRQGFYTGRNAFVCLGEDGVMEVFYDKVDDVYRPVDVRLSGFHRIRLNDKYIDREEYLKLLTTVTTK